MRLSKLYHLLFVPFAHLYVFILAFKCDLGPKYDLDASWVQVLGWAVENGLTFGKDIIFTFGPFGYFLWQPYFVSESLFWTSYIFQFVVYEILAIWLTLHLIRNRSWVHGMFCFLALIISFTRYFDVAFLLPWLLFTVSIHRRSDDKTLFRIEYVTLLVFFSIVSLAKFSFFIVSGVFWLGTAMILLLPILKEEKPVSKKVWGFSATYPLGLVIAWIVSGHSLMDLFPFIFNSLEVSSYYSSSMALPGDNLTLFTGLASLVVALAVILFASFEKSKLLQSTITAGLILFWTFFIWKISIVRQDGHVINLFVGSVVIIFISLGIVDFTKEKWKKTITISVLSVATIGLSAYGMFGRLSASPQDILGRREMASHTRALLNPQKELNKHLDEQGRLQSPMEFETQRTSKTIDMFHPNQSLLLASGENYQPRPIFQGYSAYSPMLARLNGLSYTSESSPDYVFARLTPIDNRLPAMEDSLTLLSLIQNYKPTALTHWGFLYEKNSNEKAWQAPTELPSDSSRVVPFNEWIDIPHTTAEKQLILASVSFPNSIPRKIQSTLYREGIVFIEVRLEGGEVNKHRIVIGQNGVPFILSPHIRNEYFLPGLYGDRRGKSIEAIRFSAEGFWDQPDAIELRLKAESWNRVHAPIQNYLQKFDLLPDNINKANPFPAHGGVAFMYHAPSQITFPVQEEGQFEISAQVGLRLGSWSLPEEHRTDGVTFVLQKVNRDKVEELNRIFIDPSNDPEHRKPLKLSAKTHLDGSESLQIKILTGATASGDWATIYGFELKKH